MRQSKTNALLLLLLSTSEVMWGASYVERCMRWLAGGDCMPGLTQSSVKAPEVIQQIQQIPLISLVSDSTVGNLQKAKIMNKEQQIVYILESVEISGDDTLDSVSTQLSYYSQFGFLIFDESKLNLKISDLFTNDSINASTAPLSVVVTTQYPFKIEVSDRCKQYYNETVDLKKSPNGVIELEADNGQTYKARGVIFSGRLRNEQEVRDPNTGWGVDWYDSGVIETDILVKLFKGYKLCCPPGLARSYWPHEYYNRMIGDIAVLKYPLKPKQNSRPQLEAEVCLRENGEFCIIVR